MFKEFRHFIARGNVVDLAVGVIIGAAFGKIITSLVEGVIMPPLGLILQRVDFTNLFYVLDRSKGIPASLAEAKAKAIPVIAYGQFISDVISFLIVAFVVFLLVKQVNRIKSGFDGSAARNQPRRKIVPTAPRRSPSKRSVVRSARPSWSDDGCAVSVHHRLRLTASFARRIHG